MYSKVLRKIIRDFYYKNNFTIRQMSSMFNISKSTIGRWIKNNYYERKIKYKKDIFLPFIKKLLEDNPFLRLIDIKKSILKKYNKKISLTQISKYIRLIGFTYKKISKKFHGGKLEMLREKQKEFRTRIKGIPNNKIICIDESGFMSNDSLRYGRSLRGKRIYDYSKSNPIKHNLLMAITPKGILAYEIHKDNINKDSFLSFIQNKILPYAKNKHILMDNIVFHRTCLLLKSMSDNKTKPLFIPPYSPQFNSIEYVFSIIKTKYRRKLNATINSKILISSIIDEMKNTNFNNIYNHVKTE